MGKSSSRSKSKNKHKSKKVKKDKKSKRSRSRDSQPKKEKKDKDNKKKSKEKENNDIKKKKELHTRSRSRDKVVPELEAQKKIVQPEQKDLKDRKYQNRRAKARALQLEKQSSDSGSDKEAITKQPKLELTAEQIQRNQELQNQRKILGFDSDGLEEENDDDEQEDIIQKLAQKKQQQQLQQKQLMILQKDEIDILGIDYEVQELDQLQQQQKIEQQQQLEQQRQNNVNQKEEELDMDDTLDQYMNGIQKHAVTQIDPQKPAMAQSANQVITMDEIMNPGGKRNIISGANKIMFQEDDEHYEDIEDEDVHGTKNNKHSDQQNYKQFEYEQQWQAYEPHDNKINEESAAFNQEDQDDAEDDEYYEQFRKALLREKLKEKGEIDNNGDDERDDKNNKNQSGENNKNQQNNKADFVSDDDSDNNNEINLDKREQNEKEADDYLKKISEKKVKKEIKMVDHEQIQYIKIRKNFYIESKELQEMTEQQVAEYRKKLGDIEVRGKDVAKPIQNWYQAGLSDIQLYILLEKKKFKNAFPIQCQCLPIIMSGRDTIGVAETGSGKTLAYVLPMLRHVSDQEKLREGDGPISLILAPTRELAVQIWNTTKTFCKSMGLNAVCIYGGAGIQGQLSELRKGAEIVVCTPGRLIDILTTSNGKIMNLQRVSMVIIDEADRMLDQGFEPQIRRIIQNVRPDRQTVMFSATFPRNVETLAREILNRPVEVIVGSRGQACKNIVQQVEVREECTKLRRLLEILGDWQEKGSILIFVDKQTEADELYKELRKYGHPSLLLHGGIDATDREFTIRDFKKQVLNIMIATSVCARGLDIQHISLVINFQCPNHMEDYIHRIGRTGRAGNKGTAITFITQEEDQYSMDLKKALEMSKQVVPQALTDMVKTFKTKVENGQAKIYTNKNLIGHNMFDDENLNNKIESIKKAMQKRYNYDNGIANEDSEEDDIFVKTQSRSENTKERTLNQKLAMIENPQKRQAIMQKGFQAAQQALTQGMSQEKVIEAAQNAIKNALNEYNPVKTLEQTIEDAAKLLEEFDKKEQENSDVIIYDFEINDYPPNARAKAMHRDFLQSQYELTGCQVTIRGIHIESGKRVPPGQKKLHLRIEGDSKYSVTNCYKEIKKVIEDAAMKNLSITGGYLAAPGGRYTV